MRRRSVISDFVKRTRMETVCLEAVEWDVDIVEVFGRDFDIASLGQTSEEDELVTTVSAHGDHQGSCEWKWANLTTKQIPVYKKKYPSQELCQLRAQIKALEERLNRLRSQSQRYGPLVKQAKCRPPKPLSTEWERVAIEHLELRRIAEARNTRLRRILTKQLRLVKTFQSLLQRQQNEID